MKKIELSHSIKINRKPEDVFAYTNNLEKAKEWRVGLIDNELLTKGPLKKGSIIKENLRIFGMTMPSKTEITDFVPGKKRKLKIKIAASGPVVKMKENYREKDGATELTIEGTAKLKGLQRMMSKTISSQMQNQLEQEMDNIKTNLET